MTPNQYTFRYRVRNWSDYNRALIARGRLTFWFDEDAVAAWRNADPPKGPGAPQVYSGHGHSVCADIEVGVSS